MKSTDRINLKKPKQTNNYPTNKKNHNKSDIWVGFSWFCFGIFNNNVESKKKTKPNHHQKTTNPSHQTQSNNKCNVIFKPNSWLGTQECSLNATVSDSFVWGCSGKHCSQCAKFLLYIASNIETKVFRKKKKDCDGFGHLVKQLISEKCWWPRSSHSLQSVGFGNVCCFKIYGLSTS